MVGPIPERPRDLLVAGHVNVDHFLAVREFPAADRTVPLGSVRAELGGPAATIARVASGYGVRTGIAALIGDGFPSEFRDVLARAQIDLRGLVRVPGRSTPACYILVDRHGGQRTLIDQGPMGDDPGGPLPTEILGEYAWLHVTTGPPDRHLELARRARRAGLRVAADPAQELHYRWDRRRFGALLAESEILFGNRSEIAEACRLVRVRSPAELVAQVPLIVRTEGPNGATAFARGIRRHVAAGRPRRSRSFVGAGDAFRGGFYSAWFDGQLLERCLTAGVRASTRWVEGTGG